MTTPERLRRRQRREEVLLIGLGILVGIVSIYFHGQDVKQRDCIARNFGEFTSSLGARSTIVDREAKASRLEAKATRMESRANNDFYKAAFSSTDTSEVFDAYGAYRVAIAEVNALRIKVDHRRNALAEDREANPIPDFPRGTCD